jgi:hypothetical protein
MKKPNCYACIHRSSVAGNAHSCCNHPVTQNDLENPMANILAIFAGVGRVDPIVSNAAKEINVVLNSHGVQNGWANWPWNYDPIWVENCDGFESVNPQEKKLKSEDIS